MPESPISAFDRLVQAGPPVAPRVLFETAAVLGGSVAGLLAARVLADHAREVVIIERDALPVSPAQRAGTPQDQQVHTLLPAGRLWIDRWLPGFTQDALDGGALLSGPEATATMFDGHRQAPGGDFQLLGATRPLIEACLRARVLALPNVSVRHGRATGLRYRDGAVSGVGYVDDGGEHVLETDFTVDAMGRPSRVSDWVAEHGYDAPRFTRLQSPINYATALFARTEKPEELDITCALGLFSPAGTVGGVSVAAVNAVEDDGWIVMLMGYDEARPGRTPEDFRARCAELPAVFGHATSGPITRDIATYHQAESRRRDFAGLDRFPARLIAVGDAVASFNPIYGQGMSSAALHASCLSAYLTGDPGLNEPAGAFFDLQQMVVDAAWAISAGGDTERRDAVTGAEVPEEVRAQRWALGQITGASLTDPSIAAAFNSVSYMLRHPATLADPSVVERAVAANTPS
ncbi:NAD(P)/FAD-dependent oxidoreductase [Catenuloplanes sp. NPDC051500]|uniref:NAD(P)/FAD-dependent oxidoreductase n=1 Tax=Catenuloplanes sp. NPDC051500 TaxID=3363959 RepID=UPI0037B76E6A